MNTEQLYDQAQQLLAKQQHNDAYRILKKLDASVPNHPGILYLIAICQSLSGNKSNALSTYSRVIKIQPTFAEAYNNAGLDLASLGRREEALGFFDNALKINPSFKEAAINRASTLIALNKPSEAISQLELLLKTHPNCPAVLANIGQAFTAASKHEGALGYYNAALAYAPGDPKLLGYKVSNFAALKRWDDCISTYEQLPSDCLERQSLLGTKLAAQLKINDWAALTSEASLLEAHLDPLSYLYCCQHIDSQAQNARLFAENFPSHPALPATTNKKIRVGYVSADFREHPVGYLTAGIFGAHDRSKFEIFCFSASPPNADDGETSKRIKANCDEFIHINELSDEEASQRIRSLNLDVAIDLGGFTSSARTKLFATRIAPIQISYLGFPGTMAASFIDYLIGDPIVTPAELFPFYKEKILSLPESFQANDDLRVISSLPNKSDYQLPTDSFVFACFSQSAKILPDIFRSWMKALHIAPGSILWLVSESSTQIKNLRHEAELCGIDPNRLHFGVHLPYADHLGRYTHADLVLDTSPFNGGTTTSDALWAGAPVLTLCGSTYANRMASSLLNNLGLNELITHSIDEYESKLISLATNPEKIRQLRNLLHTNKTKCSIFHTQRFTGQLEAGLEMVVARNRLGRNPEHTFVPPIK